MTIKFRITFINHLEQKINLNDYLVDIEAGSLLYEINKGYVCLDFVTNGVYYDPSIIGDDVERVIVEWQIDNNEKQVEKFCIEAIDYLRDNNIKVYCRSKSYKYEKYYINKVITGKNLTELFMRIMPDIAMDFTHLTNLDFKGSLIIENKTGFDVLEELRNSYKFEYFYYKGILYFMDKKSITKYDYPIKKFNEVEDINDLNTSTDILKKRIKEIKINPIKNDDIVSDDDNTSLKLEINPSPQPCSPDKVLIYTDDKGNKYKIKPVKAVFYVYYAPLGAGTPQVKNYPFLASVYKTMVERYELNEEDKLAVIGNIVHLNGVEIVNSNKVVYHSFNYGENIIYFDDKVSGEVKVSYTTIALMGYLSNSKYPKDFKFDITFLNRKINYTHKYVLDGYYPIPYTLILNTITDWGLSADDGINKSIDVYKYASDTKTFNKVKTIESDAFGDFQLDIQEYGTYKFEMSGQEPLFLDYFVNKKEVYMDEKSC